jgi:hypothetical protein
LFSTGEGLVAMNSRTARPESVQVRLRRIIDAVHLADVELQRHKLLL